MPTQHSPVEDGDTGYCDRCSLPVKHPCHTAAPQAPLLAPVGDPIAPVRLHQTSTSHRATARALPKSGTVKAAIFAIISNRPHGATDDELEVILGRTHQSVSASRNALMNDGWIEPLLADGSEVTRRTRSGNDATVWTATVVARAVSPGAA